MSHEILYVRGSDGFARGFQSGTPKQIEWENKPGWSRAHKSLDERKQEWDKKLGDKTEIPRKKFTPKKKKALKRKKKAGKSS